MKEHIEAISATVEPCYCGEEDHYQVETYLLNAPDRITAKFQTVTFHLKKEQAMTKASEINARQPKASKASTKTEQVQTEGAKKMKNETKSNKQRVFESFMKGQNDREKLGKMVKNAVKPVTIRSWISSWLRGDNLPACATPENKKALIARGRELKKAAKSAAKA
jgi:hypothetical protein